MRVPVVSHWVLLVVVGVLAVGVVAGGVAVWPGGGAVAAARRPAAGAAKVVDATLVEVVEVACGGGPAPGARPGGGGEAEPGVPGSTCVRLGARRADDGQVVRFATTDLTGSTFRPGQRVKLEVQEQPGQEPYYNVVDLERTAPMAWLAALFGVAVVALSRWQGLRSLVGLAVSFAVILGFVVPAILGGASPVPVALVGATAIMLVSLYLAHGIARKTTAAVLGTGLALGVTVGLSAVFVSAASLTGLASEEAVGANFAVGGLSLRGLLLAGIIIGGLGVLDDVTMSQASLVFELYRANPMVGFGGLVRSALTVGRDHVAATVNTLFLAYAGASLPLLVLFVTGGDPLARVVTAEVVAVEVVRTLCGSVGLVAAVPLTTILAAVLIPPDEESAPPDQAGTHRYTAERPPRTGAAELARPQRSERVPDVTATPRTEERALYAPAHELGDRGAQVIFGLALEVFVPTLSHATVTVAGGSWLAREELPAGVQEAASALERLAVGGSRHPPTRRMRSPAVDVVRLDLEQPQQRAILRAYGPYAAEAAVWVHGDPQPVIDLVADAPQDLPRVLVRLDPAELALMHHLMAEAGLPRSTLVPRRPRPRSRHRR